MKPETSDTVIDSLKAHYGAAARRAGTGMPVVDECTPVGSACYDPAELTELPVGAVAGSIGCANPVALASLQPGEDVMDLGPGGGIDVLLSARRVGPHGRAYGVDMTPEMLELARHNQAEAGVSNVEFLEGRIEALPLPDGSVDVVVSNCVINLSTDKEAVFTEAHRVLRPGGRLAIADVVADQTLDGQRLSTDVEWAACAAGAVTRERYRTQLEGAGFGDVEIVDSHAVAEGLWSVFVRAEKPAT